MRVPYQCAMCRIVLCTCTYTIIVLVWILFYFLLNFYFTFIITIQHSFKHSFIPAHKCLCLCTLISYLWAFIRIWTFGVYIVRVVDVAVVPRIVLSQNVDGLWLVKCYNLWNENENEKKINNGYKNWKTL